MNKARRKELSRALDLIERAREIIEAVQEEEQESFDNLPESIQYGEQGERMEGFIEILEEAVSELEDIESNIECDVIDG